MNSHPFWDFLNEAYRNGPAGGPGQAGPSRQRGHQQNADFQNWQDVFASGFPFGPMPHRGRPGPHHPPPPHAPADATSPVRPSTPPTPPEELPQYPGDEAPKRNHSHSPEPHRPSGDDRHGHGRGSHHPRRDERREQREERRDERRAERQERRDERHERRQSRHADGFGGPPPFFGRGRHCRRGRGGPPFPIHDFVNQLPYYAAQLPYYANQIPGFLNQFFPNDPNAAAGTAAARDFPTQDGPTGEGSFTIDVDVFSTSEAYLIHASVPGAKKSDIDVSYDAAKNSVMISGITQRPTEVDEVMLNSMIEGGREVGLFERKVFLDANAKVDAEGLRARLEDGVLRIELPKTKEDDWTEVKKVHVE